MTKKIVKSDDEWRAELSDLAYIITRKHGTERPFTHDDFPKGNGVFSCTCCGQPLFSADTKFDSGTGWPSFFAPLSPEVIEERADDGWFMRRTEVLCARCEAHLGHVFPDGPDPPPDSGIA